MFKYEIHLHTCGCSACGGSTAREQVLAAKQAGYAGVCFTNHFYHGNTCVDRRLPWKDFFGAFYSDFLQGKALGEQLGIDVFFGIAGGDVHHISKFGESGMAFPERLYTEENFIRHLRAGDYKLIQNGIIQE